MYFAVDLIGVVSTIVVAVADKRLDDAFLRALAFEFGDFLATSFTAIHLIGIVAAIVPSVT